MNKHNKSLKLRIQFEIAYEIIFISSIIILIGLAYTFALNLLRVNVFTIIFGVLAFFLFYLKCASYLTIQNQQIQFTFFKYRKSPLYEMQDIKEFVFYENKRLVDIHMTHNRTLYFYISEKNKKKLLNWLVNNYPDISCLFISQNEKNS